MNVMLDDPTPCERCDGGEGYIGVEPNSTPCPSCRCSVCGKETDTPPECGDCALAEDDAARRREDV